VGVEVVLLVVVVALVDLEQVRDYLSLPVLLIR
jgi:hypothetical protein